MRHSRSFMSVEKKLLGIYVCGSSDLLGLKGIITLTLATSSFKKGAEVTTSHLLIFTVQQQ